MHRNRTIHLAGAMALAAALALATLAAPAGAASPENDDPHGLINDGGGNCEAAAAGGQAGRRAGGQADRRRSAAPDRSGEGAAEGADHVIDRVRAAGPSVRPVDEESIDIDAPPEQVWALITDVTQMGRWSPECYSCEWLDGAGGPTVGGRFKGKNKRGLLRWSTTSKVVTADEPSHFAFEVKDSQMRWGYRLEPSDSGTTVREYREVIGPKPLHVRIAYALRLLGRDPDAIVRAGMQETLARLKAGAEAAPAA